MTFTELKGRVLAYLKQCNENVTYRDVARDLSLTIGMAYEICDDLYADGEIERMPE